MNAEQSIYHHYLRRLHTGDPAVTPDADTNAWISGMFTILIAVILLVVFCYFLPFMHFVKLIFWPEIARADLMDAREERIWNLTDRQRRDVLEVFFSTNTVDPNELKKKPIDKVAKETKNPEVAVANKENEPVVCMDDEVTKGLAMRSLDLDIEQPKTPKKSGDEDGESNLRPKVTKPLRRVPLTPVTEESEQKSTGTSSVRDIESSPDSERDRDKALAAVPDKKIGVTTSGWWRPFSRKKPLGDDVSSADKEQSLTKSVVRSDSQIIGDDTDKIDSDHEIVCAICLCPYEQGELIINSKRCSHLFHKVCILEWLVKNDVCPCCRVDMITSEEVNATAPNVMGKQRLCRAIASKSA